MCYREVDGVVEHRVVAIQCKNTKRDTFRDMLKALSPGLQYLTNESRDKLLKGESCKPVVSSPADWAALCVFSE